ncbi:MAG: ribosome recycling factor [Lachnospiraceae bacterium]|nr:ribosome recycling factor [Lachnospiraceae bacterium]
MDERLKVYEEKMTKSYDAMTRDFQSIRAGRANPHVLDKIRIDYYGTPTPLQQVGNISVPEPRMLQIQPWEKNLLKAIEKAILTSDVGITPSNDGSVIRLVFPELTEERRKELVKDIKKKGEATKVAIRNIRRDANETFKKMNKANEISEDDQKDLESKTQKMTDKYIADVDKAVEEKSKEILTV